MRRRETNGNNTGEKRKRQSWWDPRFGRHELQDEAARKRYELETSQPRYALGTAKEPRVYELA
jgi:hypothetical protein